MSDGGSPPAQPGNIAALIQQYPTPDSARVQADLAKVYRTHSSIPKSRRGDIDTLIASMWKAHHIKFNGTKRQIKNARQGCWSMVFQDGWNTNVPFSKPTLAKRTLSRSAYKVGTLNRDLNNNPSPHQRRGAPVYLRPNLNWEEDTLGFQHVNGAGSVVKADAVDYFPGLPRQAARANAMVQYDRYETKRVSEYNRDLVIFWARQRVIGWLRAGLDCTEEEQLHVGANRALFHHQMETEDITELVELRTCRQLQLNLLELATISQNLLTQEGSPIPADFSQ